MVFAPLKQDNLSGAAELVLSAAELWRRYIAGSADTKSTFSLNNLRSSGLDILQQQPQMAPLFNLVNTVLVQTAKESPTRSVKTAALEAIGSTIAKFKNSSSELLHRSIDLIEKNKTIFTYSKSSTILSILFELKNRGGLFKVLLCESRPMLEGKNAAIELARAGIPVDYFVDAAMAHALSLIHI